MISSESLRDILLEILKLSPEKEKYVVPVSSDWFVPTIDPEDKIGTWIGYRILSKTPYARAYQSGRVEVKPVKVSFRLSFVGPEAEKLADKVMLWEDRRDVTKAFEKRQAQINYDDRSCFTYPVRNSGFNDRLCWVVDLSAQTFYETDTKQELWVKPKPRPEAQEENLNGIR